MEHKIVTRADNSEIFPYDYENYYAYSRQYSNHGESWQGPTRFFRAHWHDDLEFTLALSGSRTDYINGVQVVLQKGQALLVNSRQLHETYFNEPDCSYLVILLHPMLLCPTHGVEQEYVAPFLQDPPYLLLDERVDWQKRVMEDLKEIYAWRDRDGGPLKIQSLFYDIWLCLYEHVFLQRKEQSVSRPEEKGLTALKDMLSYVQQNYREKVALGDIAKAGMVCKNTCISLFKKYLRSTPVNYLILYRLERSAELLRSTELSVTDVAYEAGFSNISYFIETFRKNYGCSPLEYRKGAAAQARAS